MYLAFGGLYTYLNGSKTFTGDLVVSNRVWYLNGTNLWVGNVIVRNSGNLSLGGLALNNNYTGSTTIDAGGILYVSSASGTWNNDVTNNGSLIFSGANGSIYTFANRITGLGTLGQNQAGATLIVAGTNNDFTGKTTAQATLQIYSIANLGQPSSLGAPTTAANGTITMNGGTLKYVGTGDTTDRGIEPTTSVILDSSGTGPLILNGGLVITNAVNRTLTLQGTYTNGDNVLAGNIVNATTTNYTSLTKASPGPCTWLLTGNNTYTGVTDILDGRLRFTNSASLSPGNICIRAANSPQVGVLETSFDVIRDGGTGVGQMRIDQVANGSAYNGFSARGAPITVQFGAASPSALTWGVLPFNVQGSLLLNHVTADSKLTFPNPINLNTTAAAVTRNVGVYANVAEMSGALTQSGGVPASIRKYGDGTLLLSANNTFSNVTVSAGTLTLTGTNTFRDATVTVGALNLSGTNTFGNVTVSAGAALNISGANTFSNLTSSGTTTLAGTNTFNNVTVSAGSMTLNGSNTYNNVTVSSGTLILGGSRVPGGTMTFSTGTLVLDYTVNNNDKLNPANALTLGSGGYAAGLTIVGNLTTPYTQTINGLTLPAAAHTIAMSGTTALSLGSISRAVGIGALAIINSGSGAISTTSGTASKVLTNANGIAYATYNGDWAAKDAGNVNIVAGASLGGFYTANTWAAGNNTDVTGSSAPSSGSTTYSLRFNTTGANTITLAGANTITTGGILVTPNVGANLTKITGGGTLSQPTAGNNGTTRTATCNLMPWLPIRQEG